LRCKFKFTHQQQKQYILNYYYYSITSTDANKLESIQQKFTALCLKRFFPQADYCYGFALEQFKLHTFQEEGITLMHSSLLKFIVVLYFALLLWK
jgi:hypothetical protein